jgi:hypothetical protein
VGGRDLSSRLEQYGLEETRILTDLERIEELMAAYGRSYDELAHQPYSRFEELWKSYSTRTALDRLDAEIARQRTALMSGMGEQHEVERALRNLEERSAEAKRLILNPDLLLEEQSMDEVTGFRQDKWWEHPPADTDAVHGDAEESDITPDEGTPVTLEQVIPEVEGNLEVDVEMEMDTGV